jgi:two-component system cell cycle response regulator
MRLDHGTMLVVDDDFLNRMLLVTSLEEQGFEAEMAEDGLQALELLRSRPFDVVLLDLLMPEMDGYATLAEIKQDPALQHLPVIIISALDEMESVIRCIEMGATDYLPKPFDPALLRARINASLATKRLRDLELEYLEQVGHVMEAAASVEAGGFELDQLDNVAARTDALGQLARVFQRMAYEVNLREQRLKQQIQDLQIEIDTTKQAKKVAEITESDYFKSLRSQAESLRRIVDGGETAPNS